MHATIDFDLWPLMFLVSFASFGRYVLYNQQGTGTHIMYLREPPSQH